MVPMSVQVHRQSAPASVACAILTISDTRTLDTDTSGATIADLLTGDNHTIAGREIVRDDAAAVAEAVRRLLSGPASAVITTGGTGIAPRDNTYEAVSALFDRRLDGFGELFRMLSYEVIGSAAMLSRACAGTAQGKVIFVLPGSTPAVKLAMARLILPELAHIAGELTKS
jgi:molybdenum cofactor biosynthesis protein B